MKPETIFKLYGLAMSADSRLKKDPMTPKRAQTWSEVWLHDVPDHHYVLIVDHIYREPQMLPLQPGHITKAWDELEKTIGSKVRRAQALSPCPERRCGCWGARTCSSCRARAARPWTRTTAAGRPGSSAW